MKNLNFITNREVRFIYERSISKQKQYYQKT